MRLSVVGVLVLMGLALIVAGVAMWSVPAALVLSGAMFIMLSYLLAVKGPRKP